MIKLITPNTSKISYTNSVYGFMRQVCQWNNQNKKTLIYIPYASCYRNPSVFKPNCKYVNELLISTLLLLLVPPIYLGMYSSVSTHIHPYMSKPRLLLETDDEINGLCLQWVSYIPKTTAQDVPLLIGNLPRGNSGANGLIYMPCKKIVIGVAAYPVEHLETFR